MLLSKKLQQLLRERHILIVEQLDVCLGNIQEFKSCPEQLNVIVEWTWQLMLLRKLTSLRYEGFYLLLFFLFTLVFRPHRVEIAQLFAHFTEKAILKRLKLAKREYLRL